MINKYYIIELNSSNETMFDELFDADFHEYSYHCIDDNHFEITFFIEEERIKELEEILKWYV